jgi:ribosome-associated protein
MIHITDSIALADDEIQQRFVRATGDGGQNVTKNATAVELRFNVRTPSLPPDVQDRLITLAGRHVTNAGVLVVVSRASNSQATNRETAHTRLRALLKRAAKTPKIRRVTLAPAPVREERLTLKHRQGAVKRSRKPPSEG